jgi:DNA-binding response OmpR family regulator
MNQLEGRRVLVVDDEAEIRQLIQMQLKRKGFVVDTAAGTTAAIEKMESQNFDLVICDFRMPDGTAIEVFQGLKPNTRFILVSGYSELDEERLRDLGIQEILVKPVRFETLMERVQATLLN